MSAMALYPCRLPGAVVVCSVSLLDVAAACVHSCITANPAVALMLPAVAPLLPAVALTLPAVVLTLPGVVKWNA